MFAWFCVGIVLSKVLNDSGILPFGTNRCVTGIVVTGLYLLYEYTSRREDRTGHADSGNVTSTRMLTGNQLWIAVICICFLTSIPFLWWGVIERLATQATPAPF